MPEYTQHPFVYVDGLYHLDYVKSTRVHNHGNSLATLFLYDDWMACIPKGIIKMARNTIQCQKGLSLPAFQRQYG